MPKFVIEREIPGAGKLSPQDLKGISQKSCGVLRELGPAVQCVESYVTDDKVLLRLRRPERGGDPRACAPGWVPGQQDLGRQEHDRSHDRRVGGGAAALLSR